jgi:hypothetical protein
MSTTHPLIRYVIIVIALVSLFVVFERIQIISESESVPGKIVDCEGKWSKVRVGNSTTTSTYRDVVNYKPRAVSESGDVAMGSIMLPTRAICAQTIGRTVEILVNENPENNRIYSFIQFWAISLFILFFPIAMVIGYNSKTYVQLFSVLFVGFYAYAVFEELGYVDQYLVDSSVPHSEAEAALHRCIYRSMNDENVESRAQIKSLRCQDQNITDLSSLVDLESLEKLYLQGNTFHNLDTFPLLPSLKVLSVAGNKNFTSTRGIERYQQLEEFQANKASIKDLSGVDQLKQLRVVGLMMNKLTDVSAFKDLNSLEDVTLNYNAISDISAFSNKQKLFDFRAHSTNVIDISALYENKALKIVGVSSETIECQQFEYLRSQLPSDAKVYGPKACN